MDEKPKSYGTTSAAPPFRRHRGWLTFFWVCFFLLPILHHWAAPPLAGVLGWSVSDTRLALGVTWMAVCVLAQLQAHGMLWGKR